MAISERLAKLKQFSPATMKDSKISLLLKGDPGSAKTHTALSFPEPIYMAYSDVNHETVRFKTYEHATKVEDDSPEGFHWINTRDISGTEISSWDDYEQTFIPEVANRNIDAATIVVDTIDFAAKFMWNKLQGSRSNLTPANFGTGLNMLNDTTRGPLQMP